MIVVTTQPKPEYHISLSYSEAQFLRRTASRRIQQLEGIFGPSSIPSIYEREAELCRELMQQLPKGEN